MFDIHNSIHVIVFNCSFLHNRGTGVIQEPYRGNTGALSITYNNISSSASNPHITVTSCNFTNNSALATVNFRSSNQVLRSGVLTGRGGEMAVFVQENHFNITVYVHGVLLDIIQLVPMVDQFTFCLKDMAVIMERLIHVVF